MNKVDFISEVAKRAEMSKRDIKEILEIEQAVVLENIKDEDVKFFDGLTLTVSHRGARDGRNPRTGEVVHIPERDTPKAKFGKIFKDAVRG